MAALAAVVVWLWPPVWPNLVASMLWTWPVLAWHHWRIRRHITALAARPGDAEVELLRQAIDRLERIEASSAAVFEFGEQFSVLVDQVAALAHRLDILKEDQ